MAGTAPAVARGPHPDKANEASVDPVSYERLYSGVEEVTVIPRGDIRAYTPPPQFTRIPTKMAGPTE